MSAIAVDVKEVEAREEEEAAAAAAERFERELFEQRCGCNPHGFVFFMNKWTRCVPLFSLQQSIRARNLQINSFVDLL